MTLSIVTTIVTPAASIALVSLADVKADLGLAATDDDALLTSWIGRVSSAIAQYCNRTLAVETVRDDVWFERDPYPWQVPGGVSPLYLSRWPVVASPAAVVTVLDTVLVADDDYRLDAARGQIIRLDGRGMPAAWSSVPTSITYAAGFAVIPPDIQDAAIRLVKGRWFARQRDPLLKREDIPGVRSAEYWVDTGAAATGAMPPDVVDLLDNYRVPVIG